MADPLYGDNYVFKFDNNEICTINFKKPSFTQDGVDDFCNSDDFKTQRPGKPAFGDGSFKYVHNPADEDHAAIEDASHDGLNTHTFSYELVGVGTYSWTGWVKTFEPDEVGTDSRATVTVTWTPNSFLFTEAGGGGG